MAKAKVETPKIPERRYSNTIEMVRDLTEDDEFAREVAELAASRQLLRALMIQRDLAELSQADVAAKMGCSQGKVSRLENGKDEDASFGDLLKYLGAVGCGMRILIVPEDQPITDEVKAHAACISQLLGQLVELAGRDASAVKAVSGFLAEAAFNLHHLVEEAAASLPAVRQPRTASLKVDSLSAAG